MLRLSRASTILDTLSYCRAQKGQRFGCIWGQKEPDPSCSSWTYFLPLLRWGCRQCRWSGLTGKDDYRLRLLVNLWMFLSEFWRQERLNKRDAVGVSGTEDPVGSTEEKEHILQRAFHKSEGQWKPSSPSLLLYFSVVLIVSLSYVVVLHWDWEHIVQKCGREILCIFKTLIIREETWAVLFS